MNLPEMTWQIAYGQLAWGVVLAVLLLSFLPAPWRRLRAPLAAIVAGCILLQLLPGKASPAYWLGLAFAWPSGLLTGLCLARLVQHWQGTPAPTLMRATVAVPLAITGCVLYLEAMGLVALDFYYRGFGPYGAPLLALLLAAGATWAVIAGKARAQALAVLFAVLLFALLRLPSGNVWDVLIDPLLFGWASWTLARRGWRHWRAVRAVPDAPPGQHETDVPASAP